MGTTFTATIGGATVVLSPLTPGSQTTVSGTSPVGAVSGTAFLSADSSFFYADLATVSAPAQKALLEGGIPITSASTSIGTTNQVLAYNIQQDPALGSTIPFIRNAAGGNIAGATVSPLYLVTPTGTLAQDPTGANSARALQASLAISGSGSSQQSVIATNIGVVTGTTPTLNGALRGSSLTSASGTPIAISSATGSVADGVGGGLYGSSGLAGAALAATSPFATETPLSGTPTTYNFNQPAVATTLPAGVGPGLGTNPSSKFIPANGYFGGLMYTNSNTTTSPYLITGTNTFSQTGPATFSSTFNSTSIPAGGSIAAATLTFGGAASATPNSTIIDGNIYGATESTSGATLTNNNGSPSTAAQQLYLLSSAAAPPGTLLTNGTLCSTCAFSQWGWWGGDVASTTLGRTEIGNLNTWVAGQPTVTIPRAGTASYTGQAIGTVSNGGSGYIGTGTFTNTYVFDADRGNFSLTFDGHTTAGQVGPTTFGRGIYSSGCSGCSGFTGGGVATTINGQFFGPTVGTPPETGGNFALTGVGVAYSASGVFLGHR